MSSRRIKSQIGFSLQATGNQMVISIELEEQRMDYRNLIRDFGATVHENSHSALFWFKQMRRE